MSLRQFAELVVTNREEATKKFGAEFVQLAEKVTSGELDERLADCNIPASVKLKLTKETQAKLLSGEKFEILLGDGKSTTFRDFFKMNTVEKHLLLHDDGSIRDIAAQKQKYAEDIFVAQNMEMTNQAKRFEWNKENDTIILKNGRKSTFLTFTKMVECLYQQNVLQEFLEHFKEILTKLEQGE